MTGGELQPLRTGPLVSPPLPPVTYADLYRFANGPVRDGDGYIDGTCNYYALVHLRGGGYALLYIDEQSYFVQRWRMVDPRDTNGMSLALATDLENNPGLYGWNPAAYWCPFRAGQIAANSRLAVSRQVLLVTAPDPGNTDPAHPAAVIYSINFSYATMDRSWRWRSIPIQAAYFTSDSAREQETIDPTVADRVYPETVRLREDMTIDVKGTQRQPDGTITVGRWYQRYLPAAHHPPGRRDLDRPRQRQEPDRRPRRHQRRRRGEQRRQPGPVLVRMSPSRPRRARAEEEEEDMTFLESASPPATRQAEGAQARFAA